MRACATAAKLLRERGSQPLDAFCFGAEILQKNAKAAGLDKESSMYSLAVKLIQSAAGIL